MSGDQFSNAPDSWPRVDLSLGQAMGESDLTLVVAAQLKAGFDKSDLAVSFLGVHQNLLFKAGLLYVGIGLNEGGLSRWVYVYPEVNAHAHGHFAGVTAIAKKLKMLPPVFYAPESLQASEFQNPFRPFTPNCLEVYQDAQAQGEWAMWWSTPEDPDWLASSCCADMDRAYRALGDVGTYALALFGDAWGFTEDEAGRMHLPSEEVLLVMKGPEDQGIVLSVTQEKGFRFRFLKESTSTRYRNAFWKLFADFAEQLRAEVKENECELDPEPDQGFLGWWLLNLKVARNPPKAEMRTLEQFGYAKF